MIVFQALKAFIEAKPSVYRKDMVDFIAIEFDADVSLVTMSRTLQKEKISRKKVPFSPLFIHPLLTYFADFSCKESHENAPNSSVETGLYVLQTGSLNNSCTLTKVPSTNAPLIASTDGQKSAPLHVKLKASSAHQSGPSCPCTPAMGSTIGRSSMAASTRTYSSSSSKTMSSLMSRRSQARVQFW